MRNRTKKEQKEIESFLGFLVLVAGLIGWYKTGNLIGAGIAVGITLGLIIIVSVWKVTRFKKRLQQSGIAEVDQMTGRQFEEYIGTLFENEGYRVTYTPATGDFGADLILKKGKNVIVVQAKRYKQSVGIAAVQEVIPAVKMYSANDAWVVSNSYYTKAATKLAKSNQVRLINRDELIQLGIDLRKGKTKKDSAEPVQKIHINNRLTNKAEESQLLTKAEQASNQEVDSVNKLEAHLKEYRLTKARQTGKQAYMIFTNRTLVDLVEKRPVTNDELRKVHGIGDKKIEDFGQDLLEIMRGFKIRSKN